MSLNSDEKEAMSFFTKIFALIITIAMIAGGISWIFGRGVQTVDTGLIRYQEFQEIYNSTLKIQTDLCNFQKVDDNDQMFKEFSKAQQILAQQNNLNRWIGEYNAKSALVNFNIWKSKDLPYRLEPSQFNCK